MSEGEGATVLESGAGDATQEGGAADWRGGLSEPYKDKYTEFKSMDDVFKGYEGLVSKLGKNPIVKPGDDATDEQKAEFRKSLAAELGATDNMDDYFTTIKQLSDKQTKLPLDNGGEKSEGCAFHLFQRHFATQVSH